MGNKAHKRINYSFEDITNQNGNIEQSKIDKMKKDFNSNGLDKNYSQNNSIKNNNISNNKNNSLNDNLKINHVSNENELRQEYKIDINNYHHKINNRKVKIPSKLKNYISTSKYTWYNFMPKILYEQFTKMSNIYFIIIAILQCFPEISNADGKPIILMPLSVVVIVNSIKDFYEDWKRKKSDDEENNRKVEVYDLDQEQFIIKKWKDIFVGNILKVKKGEYFPADCVLISSTDRKTHGCYIETKNLDGETNLKLKKSVSKFVNRCKELNTFQGKFITQIPNEFIYQFNGVFEFDYNDYFHSFSNMIENCNIAKNIDDINKEKTRKSIDLISNNVEDKNNEKKPNEDNNKEEKIDIDDKKDNNIDNIEEDLKVNNNLKINSIVKNNNKEREKYNLETEIEDNLSEHTYYTRRKSTDKDLTFSTLSNINEDKTVIVDNNNFLLRGCSLRQTESVLCFVVYAGKNTKIMQNSPGARAKTSSIEKRMNQQIKYIFAFQIILGLLASLFSLFQIIYLGRDPAPYLYLDKNDRPFNFEEYSKKFKTILSNENLKKIFGKNNESLISMVKNFFHEISPLFNLDIMNFLLIKLGTWCVLLNNLVPISLLMTLEMVKYFQGFFISWDIDIYDKRKKVTTKVQTSTLNEELGQVQYIFSDKTGTLTKNFMKFKRVSIGLKQYNENENLYNEDENENNLNNNNNINGEENSNNNNININKINNIKENEKELKNKKKEKYKDEYGKIRHVSFDNDEELIKDLDIISILEKENKNNENKENKQEDIKNEEDEIKTDLIDNDNQVIQKENEEEIEKNGENELIESNINNPDFNQKEILDLFMTALATCHSAVIEEKEFITNKKLIYQASSPDEVAILYFARKYKYIFLGRKDNNKIIIKKPNNSKLLEITYKIPFQFEYSSERKSMSVVIQNIKNPEEIYLFMKGADNIILSKLDKNNKINKEVINNLKNSLNLYAKEGLRILAVAYKKLTLEEMIEYQKEYIKASKSTYSKKERIEELAKIVEKDLIFLGVTAIEDELQDNVNETLKDFSDAGIKLWVLTGDKKDTAKSIAYSCGLFNDEEFNILEINEGLNKAQLEAKLNELVEQFNTYVDKMDRGKSKHIKLLRTSKLDPNINNPDNNNSVVNNINNNINNENGNKNNINTNEQKENEGKNINSEEKKENNENNNIQKEEKDIKIETNEQNKKENNEKIIKNSENEKKNEDLIDDEINKKDNIINEDNKQNDIKNENIENNNNNNKKVLSDNINEIINKTENIKPKFALVVSSEELNILSLNYELEILFYELSSRCNSVLCCRVSPIQKAKMVHLIQRFTKLQQKKGSNYYKYINQKDNNSDASLRENQNKAMSPLKDSVITLAIGDGANDVNMITSAHVGVGIIGVEGKQAARASDYAIGQFKFLKKILFYHGHESLRRNSFIIYYNFYKNFLFVMPQFFVGFYSLFSGQSIYDPWLYQLFNIVFSVLPILWFGIYDSERTTKVSMSNAQYYAFDNQKLYGNRNFVNWIFNGIFQGLAVFIFVFFSNNTCANNNSGEIQDFKSMGMMTYSLVVIIVNLKVFQMTSVHGLVSVFFLIFSIGSYYVLTLFMGNEPDMFYFGVFWRVLKNVRYFFVMGCLCIGLTFISAGFVYLSKIFYKYEIKTKRAKITYNYYKSRGIKKKNKRFKKKKKNIKKKDNKNAKKDLIKEENQDN